MVQSYKVAKVQALKEEIKQFSGFIFTDYRGLNVQQINDLRNTLREKGAQFHVVKNRSVKRVFHELGYKDFDRFLVNPTALAYFNGDVTEIAKALADKIDETALQIKGGFVNDRLLEPENIVQISALPSREVLITQIIGLINGPRAGLVFTLGGILSKFLRTLKAIETQKQN